MEACLPQEEVRASDLNAPLRSLLDSTLKLVEIGEGGSISVLSVTPRDLVLLSPSSLSCFFSLVPFLVLGRAGFRGSTRPPCLCPFYVGGRRREG